jgi:enoyl-CoA hydratase/carnithine racemase
MSHDHRVTTEKREGVFLVGLDRAAKRNAFDVAMFHQLCAAYQELERDDALRCMVLFAHGPHFTAGLDLAAIAPYFAEGKFPYPEGTPDPLGIFRPRGRKPVVVAVQGICLTIGIELALACDVRIASDDTRFGQIEIKRGIYPVGGATIRFVRECGWGNAMRWLLTADELDAAEAHRIGLVQEVVSAGKQIDRAVEIAQRIAAQAPLGVMATIASARKAIVEGEEAAAGALLPDLAPILASDDAREGLQSFLERRAARFTGK